MGSFKKKLNNVVRVNRRLTFSLVELLFWRLTRGFSNKVLVASIAFQLDLFFVLLEELHLSVFLYLHSYSRPAHARGQWSRVSITDLYKHSAGIGSSGRARKIPR